MRGNGNRSNNNNKVELVLTAKSNGETVSEFLEEHFDDDSEIDYSETTLVIRQEKSEKVYGWENTLKEIAKVDCITKFCFVNTGDGGYRAWLEYFVSFFEKVADRVTSITFDGGAIGCEEGWPCCEGPMGLEGLKEALSKMIHCEHFEFTNGFRILYAGNPALGYYSTPYDIKLEAFYKTIRSLPKLSQECKDKFQCTEEEAEAARTENAKS